jgi:hypothetical protein
MTKVAFLVSKDPVTEHGGDVELARVVLRLAAESFDIRAICLSDEPPGESVTDVVKGGLRLLRIAQHPVKPAQLLAGSVLQRRSLVHIRFDTDELLEAIEASDEDVFFCEHNYMAESFIRSAQFGKKGFVINTINTESQVWLATRGVLGRIEAPRLLRDELRVAKLANGVGCYEIEESEMYRANGVAGARFMEVTLPPAEQIDISQTGRRLVFLGGRDWPPNQEAFLIALRLWPRIAEGIPDAELCVVGAKKTGSTDPVYPDRARDLGFVDGWRCPGEAARRGESGIAGGGFRSRRRVADVGLRHVHVRRRRRLRRRMPAHAARPRCRDRGGQRVVRGQPRALGGQAPAPFCRGTGAGRTRRLTRSGEGDLGADPWQPGDVTVLERHLRGPALPHFVGERQPERWRPGRDEAAAHRVGTGRR